MENVLLTGVTGFLGAHTTIQLLERGHRVTGTLRNAKKIQKVRELIGRHTDKVGNLEFAEADLTDPNVWDEIVPGHSYVLHIASPFPRTVPKNDMELIGPAREGALAVLRAAARHGVKRVVLTSSGGAVMYGKPKGQRSQTFTEKDWTDVTDLKDTTPYFRSKTIAERAAWEFIEQDDSGLELVTILPGLILGPVLEKDYGTSAEVVVKILNREMPGLPRIGFNIVDVRSVAELHIKAMLEPKAAGERFIAAHDYMDFAELAKILKDTYPDRRIPQTQFPDFLVRFMSNFIPELKSILANLGNRREVSSAKAIQLLDWEQYSAREAVLATAESLIEQKIVD